MDGPLRGTVAALVDALIVGGSAFAGRLGYLRGGVRGPVVLSAIMRRLEARATTIDVADITEWDSTTVASSPSLVRYSGDPDR